LDLRYEAWPTTVGELAARVTALRSPDILGANVTIPHKQAIMPLLDRLAPSATEVGAVNTVTKADGLLVGHNTDADGLALALREVGWEHMSQGIVLGSGGAARAAVLALHRVGASAVCLLARQMTAAHAIVTDLLPHVAGTSLLWGDLLATDLAVWERMLAGTHIIINATSVGMAAQPGMPLSVAVLERVRAGTLVLDCITHETALLREARRRELPALDGLPMLLHQGALAFTLWTGQAAPLAVMRAALG
ncbi:MAG: shikimate dehydrogenase, partial [Ktedonobacterales bacterium]|nr:shikimate dehydrogenase [Ktedonobacterales bacterium]